MPKKLTKCLLLCGAFLMTLSLTTSVSNASSNNQTLHNRILMNINKKPVIHNNYDSGYQYGIKDAKRYKYNADRILLVIIKNHLYQFKYRKYYQGFLQALNTYHFKSETGTNYNKENHQQFHISQLALNRYLHLSNLKRRGFINGFKSLADENSNVPKKYRNNITFAKAFILGSTYDRDDNIMSSFSSRGIKYLIGYDCYKEAKGKIPLKEVISNNLFKVLNLSHKIEHIEQDYAESQNKSLDTEKKLFRQSKLSQKYYPVLDDCLSYSSGGFTKRYATALARTNKYHKILYFPKSTVSGDTDWIYGVMLAKNNNKAIRKIGKNFKKYNYNLYRDKPSKKVSRAFKNTYSIINATRNEDNQGYSHWYYVVDKNNPRNKISFAMPSGNIGYIPKS